MSNTNSQGTGGSNASGHRRERDPRAHSPNQYNGTITGQLPALSPAPARSYTGSFNFEEFIVSLRELFAHDRQIASQSDNKRCGICYLYSTSGELHYRDEEGFYVCGNCERNLGKQTLPMIRRQQK
ncbi:MAG: hypothetical protein ABI234_06165 [Ktedonobacteraceae bacterium]